MSVWDVLSPLDQEAPKKIASPNVWDVTQTSWNLNLTLLTGTYLCLFDQISRESFVRAPVWMSGESSSALHIYRQGALGQPRRIQRCQASHP